MLALKTLVAHDIHVPFHSRRLVRKFLDCIRREKPDHIVLAGDIADLHALTTHRRDPRWEDLLDRELTGVRDFLADVRSAARKARITYIKGNHEDRWDRYVQGRAPAMRLIGMGLPQALDLASLDITWVENAGRTKVLVPCGKGQKVRIMHGHEFAGSSKFPGAHALKIANELDANIHIGHTHKLGAMVVPVAGKLRFAVEGGYMADPKSPGLAYGGPAPKWGPAFSIYDSENKESGLPRFVQL